MRLIDADELERRIREAEKIFYDSEDVGIAIDCIDATKTISEWHYPSKGDYPKCGEFDATSNLVLVFWWSVDSKGKAAKVYGLDRWCEQHKEWDNYRSRPIAWMPLPDPPKEEA